MRLASQAGGVSRRGDETVTLGVHASSDAVRVVAAGGRRTAIRAEAIGEPRDWIELTTYGLQLAEGARVQACVALPSGRLATQGTRILEAARQASWDGVLLVNAAHAAGRALSARRGDGALTVVVIDPEVTSVGLLDGSPVGLRADDSIRPIRGREAREVAVSLRCLLKTRPRSGVEGYLRAVVVAGDADEVDRIGRRRVTDELEALGARVSFELDPFLVAAGAEQIARETNHHAWRRARRRLSR